MLIFAEALQKHTTEVLGSFWFIFHFFPVRRVKMTMRITQKKIEIRWELIRMSTYMIFLSLLLMWATEIFLTGTEWFFKLIRQDIFVSSLHRYKVNKDWQLHEGFCESSYHIQSIDSDELKSSMEEWYPTVPTVSYCRQLCGWLSNLDQDAQLALLQSLRNAESGFYWWG